MTSLKTLQDSFQKALLKGDLTVLEHIPDTPAEKHDILLGIYQYAYRSRLMDFLSTDYPRLHAYLGDEQFTDLSLAYINAAPSRHPNARWFGNLLPAFIKGNERYFGQPQLFELSALELELNRVFDESEVLALTLPQLGQIQPDQWPSLVFTPIKATSRLTFSTNVTDLWNSLIKEETPPDVQTSDEPVEFLVFRDDFQSNFRSMNYDEAMMWDKMAAKVPFGVLCELLAAYGGEGDAAMRAASYLQGWISSGLIGDPSFAK